MSTTLETVTQSVSAMQLSGNANAASAVDPNLKTKERIFDEYQMSVQNPSSQLTPWVIKSNKADDLIQGKVSQPGHFMEAILNQPEFKGLTPDAVPMKVYEDIALYNL